MNKNSGIQAMRALACSLVILQHATYFACDAKGIPFGRYLPVDLGQIGVGIFFVISGYVMGLCMTQGRRFLWNRAARIYPPFWIAILISAAIFLRPGDGWHFDLKSAFLVPSSAINTTYRIPFWTLCYEMAFYCAVYLMILAGITRKQVQMICLVWISAIALFNIYHADATMQWLFLGQPGKWILLSPYSVFFVIGLLFWASDVALPESPALLLAASIALWLIAYSVKFSIGATGFMLMAVSFCCLLAAVLRAQFGSAITWIGDASYGAYLIHIAVIVAVETRLKAYADHLSLFEIWLILLAAGSTAGFLYGWVESKAHKKFLAGLFWRSRGLAR
ncbi:acyltransferase family protein [Burkholderia sp. F1]|uniref:acyltransferase family protein n=1 Tax=Burkholderia sp. F1 TaxID=3366817 RepID=UPI003D73CB3D